jgi:hypothetical protein
MVAEIKKVTKKMVMTHLECLFFSVFPLPLSDLATSITPSNDVKKDGSKQDKSYGLGRVGFPRTEPAVAEQAVSI